MSEQATYFVGWDVGGWNCDNNRNSRDAICVLHDPSQVAIIGRVRRGNIRDYINRHTTIQGLVNEFCGTSIGDHDEVYLAIDTPLGFSNALRNLLSSRSIVEEVPQSYNENPYLYRQTEDWLFKRGFSPLSSIKDMIGSQSTKGIHLLAQIGAKTGPDRVGIWDNETTTAIEVYPTTCKSSTLMASLRAKLKLDELRHDDHFDAVYCALTAYLFATNKDQLVGPLEDIDFEEGWIWVPADAIKPEEQTE